MTVVKSSAPPDSVSTDDHADQVTEPLLQLGGDLELGRCPELVRRGFEHQLEQPAAQVGAVQALAERGEQQLLDQLLDRDRVRRRRGGRARAVEVERERDR